MMNTQETLIRLKIRTIDSSEFNIMINKESNVEQLKLQIEDVLLYIKKGIIRPSK